MKVRSEAVKTGMDTRRAMGGFRRRPEVLLQASTSTSRNPTECAQFMRSINWDRSQTWSSVTPQYETGSNIQQEPC
jgi:hypothetical protein